MSDDESRVAELIQRARQGDGQAMNSLVTRFRPYLKMVALRFLDDRLQGRIDASDVVQQTCLSLHRNLAQFLGRDYAQFLAWLRRVHMRNIQNAHREHLESQVRTVAREDCRSGNSALDWACVTNPSQRLMNDEDSVRLAAALEQLPVDQCTAVRLRYLEGLTLQQIAERMDRSVEAAVGLVWRGLKKLRIVLKSGTS